MGVDPIERAGGVRWRARWGAGGKRRSLTFDSELAAAEAYAKGIEESGSSRGEPMAEAVLVDLTMAEQRIARGKQRMAAAAQESAAAHNKAMDQEMISENDSGQGSEDDDYSESDDESEDSDNSAWKVRDAVAHCPVTPLVPLVPLRN